MKFSLANQSHFQLNILGVTTNTYDVLHFKSCGLALSKSYSFNIVFYCNSTLDDLSLLNQSATLIIASSYNPTYFHGFIQNVKKLGKTADQQLHLYEITLQSWLAKLQQRQSTRIYLQKTALEIVTDVLLTACWPTQALAIQVVRDYEKYPLIVQYNETDLNFIERLLTEAGLFYYFEQQKNNYKLHILDDSKNLSSFSQKQLSYISESGSNRPTASLYNMQQIVHEQSNQFLVKTDCTELQLGQLLTVNNHPQPEYNCDYHVMALEIKANQTAGITTTDSDQPTYEAVCLLQKATDTLLLNKKSEYNFPYLFAANIQSYNKNLAYLDEQGRYRALFSFDQIPHDSVQTSPPLTLLQTHSSKQNSQNQSVGMHYPLRPNTQTAVGFINGNLQQPVLLGAIHNSENPSTTSDVNQTQNITRSFSGHELLADDHAQQPLLQLATKNHDNHVLLQAPNENHSIQFNSINGELNSYAHKNLNISSNADYLQQSNADVISKINKQQQSLSKQSFIQQNSGARLNLNSNDKIQTQAVNHGMLQTNEYLALNSGENIFIQSHKNNLSVAAYNGDLVIQGQGNMRIRSSAASEVMTGQPGGGLVVTESGDIYLAGPQHNLEASEIHVFGATTVNTKSPDFNYTPIKFSKDKPADKKTNKDKDDEEEFKLFVATVYGEAGNASSAAWKAVASVIMNRVNNYAFAHGGMPNSVTEVIKKTGFDAYNQKTNQYELAMTFMNSNLGWLKNPSQKSHGCPKNLLALRNAIAPIYWNKLTTTNAIIYFSPQAQNWLHKHNPNTYSHDSNYIKNHYQSLGYHKVNISGLKTTDDYEFYAK